MIFNSKQLEELENINDSTGSFEEEGDEESGFDDVSSDAMDWRRGLIEEAAESIKRAKGRPVEPHLTYPIGSMLFEREARRFARVQRSVPGFLKVVYLSGGDREFGNLDIQTYLRDYGAEKKLSELSEQLGMNEGDVANELERLGITPVEDEATESADEAVGDELVSADAAADAAPADAHAAKKAGRASKAAAAEKAAKPKVEKAPKAEKAPAKPKAAKTDKPVAKAKPAKVVAKGGTGGKSADPIDDPNSYIKAHYLEMSNRELARFTGLSEHTIRRKLGEWGLKRKP